MKIYKTRDFRIQKARGLKFPKLKISKRKRKKILKTAVALGAAGAALSAARKLESNYQAGLLNNFAFRRPIDPWATSKWQIPTRMFPNTNDSSFARQKAQTVGWLEDLSM